MQRKDKFLMELESMDIVKNEKEKIIYNFIKSMSEEDKKVIFNETFETHFGKKKISIDLLNNRQIILDEISQMDDQDRRILFGVSYLQRISALRNLESLKGNLAKRMEKKLLQYKIEGEEFLYDLRSKCCGLRWKIIWSSVRKNYLFNCEKCDLNLRFAPHISIKPNSIINEMKCHCGCDSGIILSNCCGSNWKLIYNIKYDSLNLICEKCDKPSENISITTHPFEEAFNRLERHKEFLNKCD